MKTNFVLALIAASFLITISPLISSAQTKAAPDLVPAQPVGASNASPAQPAADPVSPAPPREIRKRHFALGIEPHWLILRGLGLQMDVRVSNKVAIVLGGLYFPPQDNYLNDDDDDDFDIFADYKWTETEVYVGPSYMITGNYDTHGAYILPAVGYFSRTITEYRSSNLSGSLNTFEGRLTGGYQWVAGGFRFTTGAGLRVLSASEIVIKSENGDEEFRTSSGTLSGLALDLRVSYLF